MGDRSCHSRPSITLEVGHLIGADYIEHSEAILRMREEYPQRRTGPKNIERPLALPSWGDVFDLRWVEAPGDPGDRRVHLGLLDVGQLLHHRPGYGSPLDRGVLGPGGDVHGAHITASRTHSHRHPRCRRQRTRQRRWSQRFPSIEAFKLAPWLLAQDGRLGIRGLASVRRSACIRIEAA